MPVCLWVSRDLNIYIIVLALFLSFIPQRARVQLIRHALPLRFGPDHQNSVPQTPNPARVGIMGRPTLASGVQG
jgi:hypothetical protein